MMAKVIQSHFPSLHGRLELVADPRKRREYQMSELIWAGVSLFLFKQGSRNGFNNSRAEGKFRQTYQRLFKRRMPHLDAVNSLFTQISSQEMELLKVHLVSQLITKKVWHRFRFIHRYFTVVIDGTGVWTYDQDPGDCIHKTSKNGRVSYFRNVLEAKLVTSNGMAISLCSEWMTNPDGGYDKQDCEQKAFKRLAARLKKSFPHLPICIQADGLYPTKPFMEICRNNDWRFLVTLQDGNLKSVQKEIAGLLEDRSKERPYQALVPDKCQTITRNYAWFQGLCYAGIHLSWIRCEEEIKQHKTGKTKLVKFVYITDLPVGRANVAEVISTGRNRWCIENQGFNTQKNQGYELEHKFSHQNHNAQTNWYQCLQIAHMINQFIEKSAEFMTHIQTNSKRSIKFLWVQLITWMTNPMLEMEAELHEIQLKRHQIRFG